MFTPMPLAAAPLADSFLIFHKRGELVETAPGEPGESPVGFLPDRLFKEPFRAFVIFQLKLCHAAQQRVS